MRILKLMVLMLLMAVGAQAQKTIQQNLSFRQEVGYLVTKYGATLYRNCGFPTNPDTLNARGKGFLAVDTCGFKFGIWNGISWQEVSGAAAGDYLDSFNIAQPAAYRLVFIYGKNGVLNKDTIDYVAGAGGGSAGIDTMSIRNDSLIYRKDGIFYFAGKVSNAVINGDTTIWEVVVDSTTLSSYYIPIAQPSGYFGKDTTLRWRPTTGALVVGANANIVQLEVNGRVATTGNVSIGGQLSIALVPIATDTTFYKPMVRHTITGEIRRLESWPSTGMTNPMTSAGDLIRGGTGGTPTRIAAGTDGYVLTMNTGIPTWMAASSGGSAAGSTGNVQFRRADGGFSAVSQFTWDSATQQLRIVRSNQSQPSIVLGGNNTQTLHMGWLGTNEFKALYGNILFNVNGSASAEFQANARRIVLNNKGTGSTDFGLVVDGNVVTIPVTVGNAVTVGSISPANGAAILDIYVTVNAGGYSTTKRYVVTTKFNATNGEWQTLLPLFSSGDYSGEDADLEFSQFNAAASFRLRRTASPGGFVGTTYVTVITQGQGVGGFGWCSVSCTSAVTAPTKVYSGNILTQVNGSVGIGINTPNTSAALQVYTTDKGSIPFPVMTQSQRTAIASPAVGLHVYQSDGTEGVYVYKSTGWQLAY